MMTNKTSFFPFFSFGVKQDHFSGMLESQPCLISQDLPNSHNKESYLAYNTQHVMVLSENKLPLKEKVQAYMCKSYRLNAISGEEDLREETPLNIDKLLDSQKDPNKNSLIDQLGRDVSISCLIRCSRVEYEAIALVNRSFRSLIQSGELYKLRREADIVEYWVYYSCSILEWEVFDPIRGCCMSLPKMTSNECFMCSYKESLAVGTELLVFGKEILSQVIYRYNILTNQWTCGVKMSMDRFMFASSSMKEIAILAGGCDSLGNILKSAELYDSKNGTWKMIPSMNKARQKCSGVIMDGKFYVLGGVGEGNTKQMTCAEEFDPKTRTWRLIPDMLPTRNLEALASSTIEAPPLVAVVNNVLYAADYGEMVVRRYDKANNSWAIIGGLPERVGSINGWGLAFRACGDRLIVIGGPKYAGGRGVEIYSYVPGQGALKWDLLARRPTENFVFNCTVMGC